MNKMTVYEKMLEDLKTKVPKDENITCTGEFTQKALFGMLKIRAPFLVTQTDEEVQKRSAGILEGTTYDAAGCAKIRGKINEERIDFLKSYQDKKSTISYVGLKNGKGYSGEWNFLTETEKDVSRSGPFKITVG